jgi:hypothetical protein
MSVELESLTRFHTAGFFITHLLPDPWLTAVIMKQQSSWSSCLSFKIHHETANVRVQNGQLSDLQKTALYCLGPITKKDVYWFEIYHETVVYCSAMYVLLRTRHEKAG